MSNRNEDRTLSGSTELYCDILDLPQTINAIRVRNVFGSAGQVLAKNPTTNKIEWAVVPIANDTITTNMIQDLAVTDPKIANDTITGDKLNSAINLNTTGALTVGGITTLKGLILFNNGASSIGTFVPATGTLSIPNGVFTNGITVGTGGELVVGTGNATFGADTIFGGELSMSAGGVEVFNMNSHNLTNGGDATFNSLTLNTALSMLNIDLDLGTGNLTCNDITCDNLTINNHTGTINFNNVDANNIDCVHLDTDRVKTDLIQLPKTGATTMEISNTGIETNGGYLDTDGGNLSMNNGDIIGANDIECVNLDAGTIEGSTNLNGIMNVGYGAIDSATNNGQITGYGGSLTIRLDNGDIACKSINTQNDNIIMGTGQISSVDSIFGTGTFRANKMELNSTGLGINTSNVIYPDTADIRGYNTYNSTNDIPRILACKSFTADHLYTRSLSTSYKNIDKDTTTLNVSFAVPISCKVIVEVGMMARSNVSGQRLLLKLVNSAGQEFFGQYINDSNHGYATTDTLVRYRQYADSVLDMTITKFFLSFPTSQRNLSVNLQPQARVDNSTSNLYTGEDTSIKYNPMYVKVESSGNQDQSQFNGFNWHMETSSGGDDY